MAGVPSNIISPFMGIDFDNTAAGSTAEYPVKVLLFGQMLSTGNGTAGTTVKITSAYEAAIKSGYGSQLHLMAKSFFANNSTNDIYIHLLADADGAAKATYSITITGTATASGELDVYIDGVRLAVAVSAGDTPTAIGTALVAAMTASANDLPVDTFLNTTGEVTFTAKNAGTVANGLDVRFNYNDGEVFPASVSAVFAVESSGATDPDVQDMIDVLGDEWYNVWAGPYSDATNLEAIETELASRNGVMRQIDGIYYCVKKDTDANLITFATNSARNSEFVALIAAYQFPQSCERIVGAYVGQVASSITNNQAIPFHRRTLSGILPPSKEQRKTFIQRNALALNGISTLNTSLGVQTDATVTMYLKDSTGSANTSYQQQNTIFILSALRYYFRNWILTRYPNALLADSAENIGPGISFITPSKGRAEAIAWFMSMETRGLVEGLSQFKEEVVCVRKGNNRLDWLLPPNLMNQFIVGSATIQFRG